MRAERKLAALADRKALLQARIAVRRMECVMAGVQLARPLAFADRVWGQWKQLSPWVKIIGVPLGLYAGRKLTKSADGAASKGKLAGVLAVLPVLIEAWKGFREHKRGVGVP